MDPVGMQAALVVCCAGAAGAWACLNGLRPVDRGVGEAEARGVGGCSRRPGRRPGSRTRLLKEEKGSRRSSYWDEYRSSVSSLPPPCRVGGGAERPVMGAQRKAWAEGRRAGRVTREPQQHKEGGEGAHGDGECGWGQKSRGTVQGQSSLTRSGPQGRYWNV